HCRPAGPPPAAQPPCHQVARPASSALVGAHLRHPSLRPSLIAAALAVAACSIAGVAAFLPARGHPPLYGYVVAIAMPVAWVIALFGLASAIAARHSADRRSYLLALACNLAALAAGGAIWLLWPFVRAA